MSRREDRLRGAIRQFLQEDPSPTAAEGEGFVRSAAHNLGVHPDRATAIYQEELNARWHRTHHGLD